MINTIDNSLFLNVTKNDYKKLLNIDESNLNYFKIAFIEDGSGIITRGHLYVNSPYWIELVDELPDIDNQEENTIYLVRE